MAEQSPSLLPPEITNPIIQRAFVMLGQPPLEAVTKSLLEDRDLQALSDDELISIIEEADQHWRAQAETCIRKPGAIERYAPLMIALCKQRYDGLHKLRDVASGKEKEALNARMGRLLTVSAHCELAGAESLLLNEKFQQAYMVFGRTEWLARALPDEGSLRVYEILWCRYGQWVAASVAGRSQEAQAAHAGVAQLLQEAEPPASACLKRVEQLFERHRWVMQERARMRQELSEGRLPPEAPEVSSEEGALLDLLGPLAEAVRSSQMTLEQAKAKVRQAYPTLQIAARKLRLASTLFEGYKAKDLDHAIILMELNCELALQYPGEAAVQAACLATLGFAFNEAAMDAGQPPERALVPLEQAYNLAVSYPQGDREAANICLGLALSNRLLHRAPELLRWSSEAVERMKRTQRVPPVQADALALGMAYGLRAESQERSGQTSLALEDHFTALGFFQQARNGPNVRKAYHHIADLCIATHRLDEASKACDALLDIAEQVGDAADVAPTSLALAQALARVGRHVPAILQLDRADRLVLNALEKDPDDKELLGYNFEFRMWAARYYGALIREAPLTPDERRATIQKASDTIEGARQTALQLHSDSLLAQAWMEKVMLQESIENFDLARSYCLSMDHIQNCPPQMMAFRYLVEGRIAAKQNEFKDALGLLDLGLGSLTQNEWDDIRIRFLKVRAHVKEQLNDRPGAIKDYEEAVDRSAGFRDMLAEDSRVAAFAMAEDAVVRLFILNGEDSPQQDSGRALYWAEYSKSRALAELLGQSGFQLPELSPAVAALYQEEQKLLAVLHDGRATSITDAAKATLEQSHALQLDKDRLKQIWTEMAALYPEYVELRRGAVPTWGEIVQMAEQ